MDFDQAFDILIGHEGGYSRHPDDPGGETMWGVTRRVAVQEGYVGQMIQMPRETAKAIARKRYWDAVRAEEMPALLRYPLFDAAYNSGPGQAIKWLQRALAVGDDGVLGPVTMDAAKRDGARAAVAMTAHRLDFMTSLPTWGAFGRGWARRIAQILHTTTEPA